MTANEGKQAFSAIRPSKRYRELIDDACLTAQAATVLEHLRMAGVRLAAILNTALIVGARC
jgi:hypothetical protein